MFHKERMRLVGIVVGNIALNAPPLVYCLHTNELQERTTEIIEFTRCDDSLSIIKVLRLTLGFRIVAIWANSSSPKWYYIQLDERYPTNKIAYWSLPLTVYFAEWKGHATE